MWPKLLLQPQLTTLIAGRLLSTLTAGNGSRRPAPKVTKFHLNQKWRRDRGLPLNPNSEGVLLDIPDYSFLDGRPTPYGIGQVKRIVHQKELAEQIVALTGEVDFAVERHARLQREAEERKQNMLDSKLKEKGVKLLKHK